jgi:single-stranded-DNA-specific exonuclease
MLPTDVPLAPHPPRWQLRADVGDAAARLRESSGLPKIIAQLLAMRGVEPDGVRDFLVPRLSALGDPFELPDMRPLVDRLMKAIDGNEKVVLYGDYDVDGVTSMSLLHLVLKSYGLHSHPFMPHRLAEGYGLSLDGLAHVFQDFGKPDLVVAMDCGTTSLAEVSWLREQGVDCVIIDHHQLSPDGRPDCMALVNPQSGTGFHYFCTVGLAFKVAHALLKTRMVPGFDLKTCLDLVALGTVADLVPLVSENRLLVRRGLEALSDTPRVGLCALKRVAGVEGLVQTHHVGYRLSPRLNAAGRLDTAFTALNLLLSEDREEAMMFAELLDGHNRDRQGVELKVFEEAVAALGDLREVEKRSAIVIGSRAWHPGVIGIVASRISRMFHRPTILVAIDESGMGKGSGRSVPGFSLVSAIGECRDHLVRGGGHAMAAGISVEESKLEGFREAFEASARRAFEGEMVRPVLEIDLELEFGDLTAEFFEHYRLMEPFGQQNSEPVFLVRGVSPKLPARVMKEKHLRLQLRQNGIEQSATWFNAPVGNLPAAPWDVVMRIQRNWFRGEERWQMTLDSVRSAE